MQSALSPDQIVACAGLVAHTHMHQTAPVDGTGGDDAAGDSDDEDGIDTMPKWLGGAYSVPMTVTNTTNEIAYLFGYIDFNRDGKFDGPEERSPVVEVQPNQTQAVVTWPRLPPGTTSAPTYARFRLGTVQSEVEKPTGPASDGKVEDHPIPYKALAVTLSYITSERAVDGSIPFIWQTATETGNAGFNILVEGPEGLVQLNSDLIASKVIDSVEPTDYGVTLATTATIFYIQEVGIDGRVDKIGPFEIGQDYGSRIDTGETDPGETDSDNTIFLPLISMKAVGVSGASTLEDPVVLIEEDASPEVVVEADASPTMPDVEELRNPLYLPTIVTQ